MATQGDSNELRVENNANIEEDLKNYNIDLATIIFEAKEIQRALDDTNSTSSSGDGVATGAKVEFKDGKADNIVKRMVPITQTMETPASDLDEKKKAQIEEKAKRSKEAKEKADEDRGGIGE